MPELPEVETIVRGLSTYLIGSKILKVDIVGKKIFRGSKESFISAVENRSVKSIDRHGKAMFLTLQTQGHSKAETILLIHLGMTGQLLYEKKETALLNHTHIIFKLDSPTHELRYRDIRRFGKMMIVESKNSVEKAPDAWKADENIIFNSLRKKNGLAKHTLLNQNVIAGLGNIYVDESLYKSKIHPRKNFSKVSDENLKHLCSSIKQVLERSIRVGGTSFQNYVDIFGGRGGFKSELFVYGKQGSQCFCGGVIKKIVVAGRGTHFCPRCQKEPK